MELCIQLCSSSSVHWYQTTCGLLKGSSHQIIGYSETLKKIHNQGRLTKDILHYILFGTQC